MQSGLGVYDISGLLGLPIVEISVLPIHSGLDINGTFQHAGRRVDSSDVRVGPALFQYPGDGPGTAAEVEHSFRLFKVDSRHEV